MMKGSRGSRGLKSSISSQVQEVYRFKGLTSSISSLVYMFNGNIILTSFHEQQTKNHKQQTTNYKYQTTNHQLKINKLFSQKLCLIGQGDGNISCCFQQHTLTAQPRIQSWIYSPVNKIFFFIRQFFNVLFSCFHIQMAGAACANTSAIVMQFDIVFQGYFQNRLIGFNTG